MVAAYPICTTLSPATNPAVNLNPSIDQAAAAMSTRQALPAYRYRSQVWRRREPGVDYRPGSQVPFREALSYPLKDSSLTAFVSM